MIRREFLREATGTAVGAGLLGGRDDGPGEVERVEELETPTGTATIKTDEYNVSHVYADGLETLAYANGYVQARDRLFQMDVLRHVGYGDSASILGEEQLGSDIQVTRDLYTREEIRAQLERAPEEYRRALEAFADGVNRKMDEYRSDNEMPAEFTLLAHRPEPWTPEDSVAIMTYLLGLFGVMGGHELGNAKTLSQLIDSLGDERRAYEAYGDLNWLEVPEDHPSSIDPGELTVDGGESVPDYDEVPDDQLAKAKAAAGAEPWGIDRAECDFGEALIDGCHDSSARGRLEGLKWGSNGMAVSGEHTETGKPMLFGGPQMGYFKPPVIYEVGLHGAGFDVTGVEVVGSPGVVVGRTPEFAWTVTSGHDDQTDTIAVDLHPEDRYRYEWDGEYHEFETFTVTHETTSVPSFVDGITDGDWSVTEVEQEVARIREDGEVMPVIAYNDEQNVAYARRTTSRGEELRGAWMWMQVGRKDDLAGVKEAIDDFPFTFNFLYADHEDVAFVHTCKVPERNPELDHRLPAPADRHEWRDVLVGRDAGIEVENPGKGYVTNWNNSPVVGWRAGDRQQQWGSHARVELLDRAVERKLDEGPLSLGDVADVLQYAGTHDVNAPASTPAFVEAARGAGDPPLEKMADELQAWADDDYAWVEADGDRRYDHAGLAIWEETRKSLQDRAFREELGPRTPTLRFDPQNSGDPHAGSHGNTFDEVTFVDALNGETAYDWLGTAPGPEARFAASDAVVAPASEVTFDASNAVAPGGSVAAYEWEFGDGTTATGRQVTHAFEEAGEYTVRLTITDDAGATATTERTIVVEEGAATADVDCGEAAYLATDPGAIDDWGGATVHDYEFRTDGPCALAVSLSGPDDADLDLYLTVDGREPTEFDYDRRAWSEGSDEAVTLGESELDPDATVRVLVKSYTGTGEYTLRFVERGPAGAGASAAASTDEVVRAALRDARDRLTERFDDDDPGAWHRKVHRSKFQAIGVVDANEIPMVNRGTWNHVVALGEGLDGSKGILPPSNSGHITFWEEAKSLLGEEPERLTDQLREYRRFEYKPLPVTPDEVERVTDRSKTLSY